MAMVRAEFGACAPVAGFALWCDPRRAAGKAGGGLRNYARMRGVVAVCERGGRPFADTALLLEEAGAAAVVFVNDDEVTSCRWGRKVDGLEDGGGGRDVRVNAYECT